MHPPQRPGRVGLESVAERAENLVAPAPLPALGPAGRVKQRTDGYLFVEHCWVQHDGSGYFARSAPNACSPGSEPVM